MRISIYNELAIIGLMRSREVIYDEWNTLRITRGTLARGLQS